MSQSVLILGRQPELGIAEAESLFGSENVSALGMHAVAIEKDAAEINFRRIGGSTRLAKLLTYLPYTDWNKIEDYLKQELPKHTCCLPEGKVRLGLSLYGFEINVRKLNASGLTLKKVVKNPPGGEGRSVRIVPNKDSELNTAQVIHNQLTGPTGMELLLIRDGERTALAQTVSVQDIEAYAARDQARPARDARVGMLPPKLAQIIINLSNPEKDSTVLDPFCGTGVLLQEAMIMGFSSYGTDLEPRMIDYSQRNLQWLKEQYPDIQNLQFDSRQGDATDTQWPSVLGGPSSIACETYLGRPFSSIPKTDVLDEVMRDVDLIHRKFLKNVARQTQSGFRMCIAIPAWNTPTGFKHLKMLDSLEELGYNRVSFALSRTRDLIYYRENQVVGRELVTLIRK